MRSTAGAHGLALARQTVVVDTGAAPDPRGDLAAGERGGDRGRGGGVADAHLAEHEQVGVERVDGVAAGGDGLVEALGRSIAGSKRMSPVGRPTPTSIASTVAPATAANALTGATCRRGRRRASPRSRRPGTC